MQRWDEIEQLLRDEAARDLLAGDPARPGLVAFRGEQPLLLAFLRPHAKGEYAAPMVEVLTVAAGLRADRLMASFSGRAWSWDDPIPPVLPGVGDLRQRVVSIHRVDGSGEQLIATDVILPYELEDGGIAWGTRLDQEAAQGWIPAALRAVVERGGDLAVSDAEIAEQVARCDRLGHLLGLSAAVSQRLGFAGAHAG